MPLLTMRLNDVTPNPPTDRKRRVESYPEREAGLERLRLKSTGPWPFSWPAVVETSIIYLRSSPHAVDLNARG